MKTIEMTGKNIQDIIELFKVQHDLADNDFDYEVIREARKGFLGFIGNQHAIVRFQIDDLNSNITAFIKKLSDFVGINVEKIKIRKDPKYIYVDLSNISEAGFLIGKDGKFLLALQYLLNQAFMSRDNHKRTIIVDIEGYKERQDKHIFKKAQQLAEQALRTRRSITMDYMNAAQRRIVHQALKEMPDIKTMTIGDGQMKKIVLSPGKKV
jgi:spoIIIJ-associated protein